MAQPLITLYNTFIVSYFLVLNSIYIFLIVLAFFAIRKYLKLVQLVELKSVFQSPFSKPISILAPAFNEEASIVNSVNSLLQLEYPLYEVVVINDGSTDRTLEYLKDSFDLKITNKVYRKQVECAPVRGVYESKKHPNLLVIDKVNGGGKADAMNAGINASSYPLFCAIDSDSIIEKDVLLKIIRPFIQDTSTVAAGGTVRIINGCKVRGGIIDEVGLPKTLLGKFQIMEYFRAFLAGRVAFSSFSCLLIISGAFGLFKKQHVIDVGGYWADAIGEDMELVVRLHKHLRQKKEKYKIVYIPDPVCWTEAPETYKVLGLQRKRWQRGLLQCLSVHSTMFLNPKYGVVGMLAFPFFLIFEGLGPIVEFVGVILFLVAWYFDLVNAELAILFFIGAIILNIVLSLGAVILEEMTFRRYPKLSHVLILCGLSALETFIYRPANTWWRLVGTFQYAMKKKVGWGVMEKKGF
ncbi:MAG: glycosyltransferase family 2 protein [Candidatus Nitrohelix vancouverensis]|uniref:Glycosyltransferase family 2 protein n=1 Tax=Candidatus Nitrohelix vancouverensis TaxID=2705534 RepID=A0A7T0C5B6_9BACT|nr:MAG: glycosyltransferase family 2 protein [Candidatus Nitrohelix vancouverensis]